LKSRFHNGSGCVGDQTVSVPAAVGTVAIASEVGVQKGIDGLNVYLDLESLRDDTGVKF
jgi:formylmethanofuran:tetrahydromethanopterin formyltransferase